MDNQEKEDSYKARLSYEVEQIRSKYLPQDQNKLEQLKKDSSATKTSNANIDTLKMWPSVRKGEFKWIYKTQNV